MSKLNSVITRMTIMTIPKNALLDGVVKLLKKKVAFKDATDNNEVIYQGDVFEEIGGELAEQKKFLDACMIYPPEKVINQLDELAKLVDTDYVLITHT